MQIGRASESRTGARSEIYVLEHELIHHQRSRGVKRINLSTR